MKVWDRAWIELATPGSAVRLTSVARHVIPTAPCGLVKSVFDCLLSGVVRVMLDVQNLFTDHSKLRSIPNLHSLVTVAITCLKLKSIIYQSSSVVSAFVNRASIIGENCSFIEIFIAFCILNKTGFQIN